MMMSVAGHAMTHYVQFRALAELLIQKGVLTREELEQQFTLMREGGLQQTIDEWFEPDIAYHVKMAVASQGASQQGTDGQEATETQVSVSAPEPDEIARARAVQSGE